MYCDAMMCLSWGARAAPVALASDGRPTAPTRASGRPQSHAAVTAVDERACLAARGTVVGVDSYLGIMTKRVVAAEADGLTMAYGEGDARVLALDGVSLELFEGEFTAVMGPSGSGKSTLMHCLAALETPSSGRVFIGDIEVSSLDDKRLTRLRRDHIGFIFQSFNLVPTLTARENIMLPASIAGRKVDQELFDDVIDAVGLRERLGHRPSQLSGGQQQRVACARALVTQPDIIFADEPTGNLDSRSGEEVLSFLRRSVDRLGQTIVMVTHDPVAAGFTDRVVFLADGRVVDEMREPTSERVLDRMKAFDAAARR